MKYALISEEQIKQVRDALGVSTTHLNKDRQTVLQALDTIQSLKPSEPVAIAGDLNEFDAMRLKSEGFQMRTPLFAMEQTK
jgi:hypothetical protein